MPQSKANLANLHRRFVRCPRNFISTPHDRGYAASREQAMVDFKAAWERKP
jgi:hypothetical protein